MWKFNPPSVKRHNAATASHHWHGEAVRKPWIDEERGKPLKSALSPAPYIGGKRILSKVITEKINAINHTGYAEPFFGMGGVFFRRDQQKSVEVINDINQDIATLFKVLQRHARYLIDFLEYAISSRAEFERLSKIDPVTMTDIERAARFIYLQRLCFGGNVNGRSFGVNKYDPARFNVVKVEENIKALHARLAGVTIENLPWQNFLERYDRKEMLFYLDPPYFGCETDYGKNIFSVADFENLAATLKTIKGKFLLSLNAVPEVYEIFSDFKIEEVNCKYSISKNGNMDVKEVIICQT